MDSLLQVASSNVVGRGHPLVSLWLYPFIQLIHFSGLSIWLGTNVVSDLRLMNLGKKPQTARDVRDELFAWNWIGFCIVVLGGFPALCSPRDAIHR